jgi:uncharacterized protein (DUF1800 family)
MADRLNLWAPYTPDDQAPWDLRRVSHLHRRAGFAATWAELQRDLKDGPQASIDRVLTGKARASGVPAEFEPTAKLLADAAVSSNDPGRLKAWWVYRMLFGPDPLTERLALVWHDHFATSNLKVNDLGAMHRQNDTFRKLARAPFGELLRASVREPALLMWLDAPANRKGHPNENLGRELMELFTLGLGHFTEADVKDAARALTGWTVEDREYHFKATAHDDGSKTLLGKTGPWTGDDLVRMLLEHPATADRLAWRLCGLFFGEGQPGPEAVKALAADLRAHQLDVGRAVETILRSRAFFAAANLGARVQSPVEFVIGAARALELAEPPPSTLALADWAARLGQDLFYPPNVGGWPGGRSWVTTRSAVGRSNFAASLVAGPGVGRPEPFDAQRLARKHGRGRDRNDLFAFYGELLRGAPPAAAECERLHAALRTTSDDDAASARGAVSLLLAAPEGQLG